MTTKPGRTASATAWRSDAAAIVLDKFLSAMALTRVNREDALVLTGYGVPP
ncbi:hypothetical protein [Cupriavidus sp.]|uniref:hypothetical protein n=1 Tax=Cupriavidus sp. TaxID=1873897 RepID=UPI003D0CDF57